MNNPQYITKVKDATPSHQKSRLKNNYDFGIFGSSAGYPQPILLDSNSFLVIMKEEIKIEKIDAWPILASEVMAKTNSSGSIKEIREIHLTSQRKEEWYLQAKQKLKSFKDLPQNWNSYGAEVPNDRAIFRAERVLETLHKLMFPPTRIVPSAENGIGICFLKGKRYADIECFNNDEVLAVLSDSRSEPTVWKIDLNQQNEIEETVNRIRAFLSK